MTGTAPLGSVIIPAHNEAGVLRPCLDNLLEGVPPGALEVVVVANGCTDDTSAVALSFANRGVRCIEVEEASKTAAIRAGESAVTAFPRMYLDADVRLTGEAAAAVFDVLSSGRSLAASPRMHLDTRFSSKPAKLYLDMWRRLPVFRDGYLGVGCYSLSESGRRRFGEFPDVVNDDQFINQLFAQSEKQTVHDVRVVVTAPTNLRNVFKRSLRVRAGRIALATSHPTAQSHGSNGTLGFLVSQAAKPRQWPSLIVFAMVQSVVVLGARLRRRLGIDAAWLRDDTSRNTATAAPDVMSSATTKNSVQMAPSPEL